MLACCDFVPNQLRNRPEEFAFLFRALQQPGDYETFAQAIAAAGAWIAANKIKIVNIETVVLPNIWEAQEEGSQDVALRTYQQPTWHQFVRVWYEE